jgi:hypothetical protein
MEAVWLSEMLVSYVIYMVSWPRKQLLQYEETDCVDGNDSGLRLTVRFGINDVKHLGSATTVLGLVLLALLNPLYVANDSHLYIL